MTDLDRLDALRQMIVDHAYFDRDRFLDTYDSLVAENKALREVEEAAREFEGSLIATQYPYWFTRLFAALHHKDGAS